ncbi:MAG: alpha/beta fold hydrolase [Chloroflexi bacterium]|nr:alpha/beta fold hydrolase [Chloroflexota bacterium]
MRKKLRGVKRRDIQYDFDLYRERVPMRDVADSYLSVVDLWPEGARDTIMFVHGYAGVLESWEFQINYFVNAGYRVVAPDLRGHGQSDAPFTDYTMPELVSDLQAIVEDLDFPDRFILAAHSFGGAIAIEYANAYPERLSKLILIATAGEYPLPRSVNLLFRVPLTVMQPFWRFRPRWDAELHVMKRMAANNMQKWQGWSLMRNIRTPTLVITGERDFYFPRAVFEDVVKAIPNAEFYDVGASKHKVQLERHDAVNRAIERFIEDERRTWRDISPIEERFSHRPWLKSYSKETPVTVPIPRRTLPDFLESAAYWIPKRAATVFYGKTLTYEQLYRRVNRFANVLHGMGVGPADRVAVVLPNMPEFIIAYYAVLQVGGVVVLPNPEADLEQMLQEMEQTAPKVIVTLRDFRHLMDGMLNIPSLERIVAVDFWQSVSPKVYKQVMRPWGLTEPPPASPSQDERIQSWTLLMQDAPTDFARVKRSLDDLAAILFTSGTVDEPKGVCLSHANLVANTVQTRHWLGRIPYGKQVSLAVIPLVHSYGMTTAMNVPIAIGATIVLLSVFDVQAVLQHIQKHRPTLFPGVPPMYAALMDAPNVRSYGLSSIQACLSGAAPLPIEVQEAFEKLTHGRLVEGYGLTEASPVTHANPLVGLRKTGSIGIPIPNTDAKIVDMFSGETLPSGQVGELVVRGPQVMLGYWAAGGGIDEKATAEVLKDGWLYTGDVAVQDEEGYFRLISRKRDTIFMGDYTVYPRDVEEVLYENAKVREVAVVGVGTEEGSSKIKAFVVPDPGANLSKEELLELCRRRLAPYEVPWEIEFRDELPKSFVGKVLRRMLVTDGE